MLLIGRFGLFIGVFLILTSGLATLLNPPGSAEFVISVVTVGVGTLVVVLGLLSLLMERKRHDLHPLSGSFPSGPEPTAAATRGRVRRGRSGGCGRALRLRRR
jgi:hypothetical protein